MNNKTCPVIIDIKFDDASRQAIDDIAHIIKVKKIGWVVTLVGQLGLIFAGGAVRTSAPGNIVENSNMFKVIAADSNQVSWSIYQTNWEYFFKSFSALDQHANSQIEKIAMLQHLRTAASPKERSFWAAIYNGCKVNK